MGGGAVLLVHAFSHVVSMQGVCGGLCLCSFLLLVFSSINRIFSFVVGHRMETSGGLAIV